MEIWKLTENLPLLRVGILCELSAGLLISFVGIGSFAAVLQRIREQILSWSSNRREILMKNLKQGRVLPGGGPVPLEIFLPLVSPRSFHEFVLEGLTYTIVWASNIILVLGSPLPFSGKVLVNFSAYIIIPAEIMALGWLLLGWLVMTIVYLRSVEGYHLPEWQKFIFSLPFAFVFLIRFYLLMWQDALIFSAIFLPIELLRMFSIPLRGRAIRIIATIFTLILFISSQLLQLAATF